MADLIERIHRDRAGVILGEKNGQVALFAARCACFDGGDEPIRYVLLSPDEACRLATDLVLVAAPLVSQREAAE